MLCINFKKYPLDTKNDDYNSHHKHYAFAGILLVRKAPKGAAATPPSMSPRITFRCVVPIIAKM